jgi:hypothetical protein
VKFPAHNSLNAPKVPFLLAAAIFLFACACFFPNPALPIGSNTGLQAGQIMALMSLPFILLKSGVPKRQTLVSMLLFLPVLLSGFLTVLTDNALANDVVLKVTIAMALVLVVLVPAGKVVNEKYAVLLLSGVAWAIVLNALLGLYQAYRFTQDVFPLPGIYQNPSFSAFMGNDPEHYALYVKRPFGFFPEPSAMAASIGPWLILIVGLLLYPKLRGGITRVGITRGTLIQLFVAVVCGVGLIIVSSSGFTLFLLTGLLLVALPYLKDRVLRLYRPGNLFLIVALVLVGTALVVFSVSYVGSRIDVQENSSWSARLSSIVWSLTYFGASLGNMVYGVGPGQSNLILESSGSSILPPVSTGGIVVNAIWSLIVSYVLETGLLGALVLVLVLTMVLRAIVRSSARLIGFSCLGVWLAGVTVTTSYLPLLPIWLFLGALLAWDRIFPRRTSGGRIEPKPRMSRIREGIRT